MRLMQKYKREFRSARKIPPCGKQPLPVAESCSDTNLLKMFTVCFVLQDAHGNSVQSTRTFSIDGSRPILKLLPAMILLTDGQTLVSPCQACFFSLVWRINFKSQSIYAIIKQMFIILCLNHDYFKLII